jgi:hypothetical protein
MLFGHWNEVADETVRSLGEEQSGLFVELYSDALEIHGAIATTHPEENEPGSASLTYFEFLGLWKEVHWFHALFLSGNYRLILSQLRFNWERIFRARFADAFNQEHPGASDCPGPTLDDKCDWLMKREDRLNWTSLVLPTLKHLYSATPPSEIEPKFKPLWDRLNRCVHPSGALREKLVGDSALLMRDAFDKDWAQETLNDTAAVFTIIWLAILSRFPVAVPILLAKPCMFRACPQLRAVLQAQFGTACCGTGTRIAPRRDRPTSSYSCPLTP